MSASPSTPSTSKATSGAFGKIFNKLRTPSGGNGSPSGGGGGESTPRSASPFGGLMSRKGSSKSSLKSYGSSAASSTTSLAPDEEDEPAFPTFDSDALDFFHSQSSASSSAAPSRPSIPYMNNYPSTSSLASAHSVASSSGAADAPFADLTVQPPSRPGTSMSVRSRAPSLAESDGGSSGWKSSLLARGKTPVVPAEKDAGGSFGRALGRSLGFKGKESGFSNEVEPSNPPQMMMAEPDREEEDELTHKVSSVKAIDYAIPPPVSRPVTRQTSRDPPLPLSSSLATTTPGLPRAGLTKSTTGTSTAGPSAGTRRLFRTTTAGGERIVGRARRVVQPATDSTPESQPSFSESESSIVKETSPEPPSSSQVSPNSSSTSRGRPPISPNMHGRSRSELPPSSPKMAQTDRSATTVTIAPTYLRNSAIRPSSAMSHYSGSDDSPLDGSQLSISRSRLQPSLASQQPLGSTAFRNRFLNSSSSQTSISSTASSPDLGRSALNGATPSPPLLSQSQTLQPKIKLGPMAGGLSRKNSISMLSAVSEKPDQLSAAARAASLDSRRETVAARVAGQLAESQPSAGRASLDEPRDRDRDMMMPYQSRRTSSSVARGGAGDVSLDQSISSVGGSTLVGSSGSSLKRSNSETVTNGSLLARPGSSTAVYREELLLATKPSLVRLASQQDHLPPPVAEVMQDEHQYQQEPYQQHRQPLPPPLAEPLQPYHDENAYDPHAPASSHPYARQPAPPAQPQHLPPQQHPASVGGAPRPVLAEVNRYQPQPPSTQQRQPLYQKPQAPPSAQQQQPVNPHEYHVPLRDRSPGMAEATPSVTVQQAHYQSHQQQQYHQQQQSQQQQQQQMMMQQQMMQQMGYTPGQEQQQEKKVAKAFTVNGKVYHRAGILGKGGSSRVYRVMTERNELYALKKVDTRNDAESRASFINEITLLRKLSGKPEIIQLVDSEVQGKYVIMVMEAGETDLAGLLAGYSGKPISLNFIRYIWEQMLSAVQVVHDEAVVHTDLKPANFVLVKGRLKLIDFGISKAIAGDTTNIGRDQQIGTANYMPPEALNDTGLGQGGKRLMKLGRAADVWSLGCILYQMVYGGAPFSHIRDIGLKINSIMNPNHRISFPEYGVPIGKRGEPLEEYRFKVGPDLIATLKSCLIYDSKKRAAIPELLQQPFLRRSGDEQTVPQQTSLPRINDQLMEAVVKHVADKLVRGKLDQDDVAAIAQNLMSQVKGLQDSL